LPDPPQVSKVPRHKTAIRRATVSRPIRLALEHELIRPDTTVADYGCGKGDDLRRLKRLGVSCHGWDPVHRPDGPRRPAAVVNLGYVLNVIEEPRERVEVLRSAWELAEQLLIVSARITADARDEDPGTPFRDGLLTRLGTFQKYYEHHELRDWLEGVLDQQAVAAGPGIFYLFRNSETRQSFLASQYRRRGSTPSLRQSDRLFAEHRELFEALMEFLAWRGRPPDLFEFPEAKELVKAAGSIKRACTVVRRVTDNDEWLRIREERAQDLLVYLGLSRFDGRPRFGQLSRDLQLDVKAFFSTYTRACTQADDLLLSAGNLEAINAACRHSPVGKVTPSAIYVHKSALEEVPPILRIYEGCDRGYIGAVEGANVIKLNRTEPQVSYLTYPEFERDPHPALARSLSVALQTFRINVRDYQRSSNPPILHRKEEFVAMSHPQRPKFERLTQQEERWGLYDDPATIGTRRGWQQILARLGVMQNGHRLTR